MLERSRVEKPHCATSRNAARSLFSVSKVALWLSHRGLTFCKNKALSAYQGTHASDGPETYSLTCFDNVKDMRQMKVRSEKSDR